MRGEMGGDAVIVSSSSESPSSSSVSESKISNRQLKGI